MCPSQLAKQTLNKNNNTTTHQQPQTGSKEPRHHHQYCKDTHYKNKHPHKNNPQQTANSQNHGGYCAGDARVHYPKIKKQETTSSTRTRHPLQGTGA